MHGESVGIVRRGHATGTQRSAKNSGGYHTQKTGESREKTDNNQQENKSKQGKHDKATINKQQCGHDGMMQGTGKETGMGGTRVEWLEERKVKVKRKSCMRVELLPG